MLLSVEEIKEKLKDRRPGVVAMMCGISRQALYLILNGKMKPSYETLVKLNDYIKG